MADEFESVGALQDSIESQARSAELGSEFPAVATVFDEAFSQDDDELVGLADLYSSLFSAREAGFSLLEANCHSRPSGHVVVNLKLAGDFPKKYGPYKVTANAFAHICGHLVQQTGKAVHSVFTNKAVINTVFSMLADGTAPAHTTIGPGGRLVEQFGVPGAGKGGQNYVTVVSNPRTGEVITAFPAPFAGRDEL
jgi:hypothetical protein